MVAKCLVSCHCVFVGFAERFVIYRDGVSDGEYGMVLSNEVPRIEAAIAKARGDDKADVTVVVCTKRHDARFFLANIPRNAVRFEGFTVFY